MSSSGKSIELDNVVDGQSQGYPPYNIERTGESAYRITMAVAGFGESELDIVARESTLTIKGEKTATEEKDANEYLYRGIAARSFERRFQLADHVEVKAANLENGLLHIDLVRENLGKLAADDPQVSADTAATNRSSSSSNQADTCG